MQISMELRVKASTFLLPSPPKLIHPINISSLINNLGWKEIFLKKKKVIINDNNINFPSPSDQSK